MKVRFDEQMINSLWFKYMQKLGATRQYSNGKTYCQAYNGTIKRDRHRQNFDAMVFAHGGFIGRENKHHYIEFNDEASATLFALKFG